jgi:hypothetical protein
MMRFGQESMSVALRGLARDARRVAVRGVASPGEMAALSRRIDRVRRLSGLPAASPLRRWLDSLERLIECHSVPSGTCIYGTSPRAGHAPEFGVAAHCRRRER